MEYFDKDKYERAKKRMEEIKGFYTHLVVYVVINIGLILVNIGLFTKGWMGIEFPGFAIFSTPFFWGIGLVAHGLYVFQHKFTFFKQWEERKMKEYMEQEEEEYKKTSRWD
ncbi:MAG: 2TM domain-containing protein [Aureisphaera sp.]